MRPPRKPLPDDFEIDPLWDLLGKAEEKRSVSPFFARNVIREIRLSEARRSSSPFLGLLRNWRLLASSMAMVGIVTFFCGKTAFDESAVPSAAFHEEIGLIGHLGHPQFSSDLEVIKNLDELLDLENSVWLETTASAY